MSRTACGTGPRRGGRAIRLRRPDKSMRLRLLPYPQRSRQRLGVSESDAREQAWQVSQTIGFPAKIAVAEVCDWPLGEIGRHARFRILSRKGCRFKSGSGHSKWALSEVVRFPASRRVAFKSKVQSHGMAGTRLTYRHFQGRSSPQPAATQNQSCFGTS